jgi:hypothetical protein
LKGKIYRGKIFCPNTVAENRMKMNSWTKNIGGCEAIIFANLFNILSIRVRLFYIKNRKTKR